MTWWKFLFFSLEGRIGRKAYWIGMLIALGPFVWLATLHDIVIVFFYDRDFPFDIDGLSLLTLGLLWIPVGFLLASVVTAKRLHDRERSHWWLVPLLYFAAMSLPLNENGILLTYTISLFGNVLSQFGLPKEWWPILLYLPWSIYAFAFIISLWLFVEVGFLKGAQGSDSYGDDPLERQDSV